MPDRTGRFAPDTTVPMLDPALALPSGLFHFRVVVGVALWEPEVLEVDEHGDNEQVVGFYRTYGVTAASAGAAVGLVEKHLGDGPDDAPEGSVAEIDVAVLDTGAIYLPVSPEELDAAGIHFESGRAFFTADDLEDDDHE